MGSSSFTSFCASERVPRDARSAVAICSENKSQGRNVQQMPHPQGIVLLGTAAISRGSSPGGEGSVLDNARVASPAHKDLGAGTTWPEAYAASGSQRHRERAEWVAAWVTH